MLSIFSQFIFGNSHSSVSSWKDKNLCFDIRSNDLKVDQGEQLIGCFFPIEDTKGNPDQLGLLKITNLRLIWICCDKRRVNLSIGWHTVTLAFEQNLRDSLNSIITSLCVLTKYESTKYEFVFNKMPKYHDDNVGQLIQSKRFAPFNEKSQSSDLMSHLSPMYLDDPYDVVFKVWQAYKRTNLFRHCRANLNQLLSYDQSSSGNRKLSSIIKLPGEETIDVYSGIAQTESKSIKHLGTLILSNVRVIWIDETIPLRNLSIPYIRIDSIKSKQSDRIIINTLDYLATSNQIVLRPQKSDEQPNSAKRTKLILEQIQNLHSLYKTKPKFGPESCDDCINYMSHLRPINHYFESISVGGIENLGPIRNRVMQSFPLDDQVESFAHGNSTSDQSLTHDNVEQTEGELSSYRNKLRCYLNEEPLNCDKDLIYSSEIGLTFERPDKNVDLERIWRLEL